MWRVCLPSMGRALNERARPYESNEPKKNLAVRHRARVRALPITDFSFSHSNFMFFYILHGKMRDIIIGKKYVTTCPT